MLWIIYIVILLILLNVICSKDKRLLRLSEQLKPKTPCLPILGHALYFYGNTEELLQAMILFSREAIQNGGLTCIWLGNVLLIDVADAADAEFISKNYMEKGYGVKSAKEVSGNGSIFAPVSIWHPRRKILVPTFKPKNIQRFASIFTKQALIMAKQLKSRVDTGAFSIWDYLTTYTLDSICESTLGVDLKTQEHQDHPFFNALEEAMRLTATRICRPWLYNDFVYKLCPSYYSLQKQKKYLYDFCSKVISTKRKKLASQSSNFTKNDKKEPFKSFLELLIESSGNEKDYSDLELREEILVLIIAGNDTSATGACFTTLMLSRHPDVQQKAYEELNEVLDNFNRTLTPEDVPKLKYLDAVIKETLRLYPPVPFTLRYIDRDLTLPSGITLVEGCDAVINIYALHRNPKYWGIDAEEFRPERWFDLDMKHPAQFMPFSYGPRNCVGYQYAMIAMKTALATILSQYRILPESGPNKEGVFEPLRLKFDIMMKDVNKFTVKLENRY